MVPRSISRVTDSAVKISMVRVRIVPIRPGTMLSWLGCRVVAGMRGGFRTAAGRLGDGAVVAQRRLQEVVERSQRGAGRHRIGRVGRDQQGGPVAAPQRALETARNFDRKQHLAGRQHLVELILVAHLMGDPEILGVLQRLEDGAADVAAFLQQHRCRQWRGLVLMA